MINAIKNFWHWLTGLFSNKKAESSNIKRFYSKLDANEKALNEHWKDMQLLEYSYKDLMKAFLSTRVTYGRLEPNKESEQVRDLVAGQPARSYIPQFSPLIFLKPLAYVLKAIGIIKEPEKPKQPDAGTIDSQKMAAGEQAIIKSSPAPKKEIKKLATEALDAQLVAKEWKKQNQFSAAANPIGALIGWGLFKYAEYKANQLHKTEDAAKISTNTLRK